MAVISVNLLPEEIVLQRKHNSKIAFINKLSLGSAVALIFATSAVFGLRISQNVELKDIQQRVIYAQEMVSDLQTKEGQMLSLQQRLSLIQTLGGNDEKKKAIFNLLIYLSPSDIRINELSIDKKGNLVVLLSTGSLASLETLLSGMGDKEKSFGLISKMELESLSLGRNSIYNLTLKITPK